MFKRQSIKLLDRFRNPKAQLVLVAVMLAYFVGLITWQHTMEHHADPIQQVLEIHPRVKRLASQVHVGMHINNFPEFSFNKNSFLMDVLVWFSFPIGTESLHTIEQFSFQNGEIKKKSLPTIKINDKIVMVSFQTTVSFKTSLDYRFFPISDHRLNIVLENRSVTPNEMCFISEATNFAFADDLVTGTWTAQRKIAKAGYIKSLLTENKSDREVSYPCIAYTIEFSNGNLRDLISLYFPLFIIFLFSFFALMIDVRKDSRSNMIVASMPTLALFRLVIDNVAPVASKITLVDYLYYILVSIAFVVLLFQVYILLEQRRMVRMKESEKEHRYVLLEFINSGLFISIVAALVGSITYIHLY